MSNPTSNFNWQMPTNTDLVSQLPADFEVFGQAVDTSLADLKGGTTGQVLKKNSNTDMDFVWSADSAGMTNPMTTTGDTIYSSSGSTPARLGIGSTGQVLTVSGGLPSWATPATPASGVTKLLATTFSAVSSYSAPNNTFSATYNAYKVMVEITAASASSNFQLRARAGGTDYASGGYTVQRVTGITSSASADSTAGTEWALLSNNTNTRYFISFDWYRPYGTGQHLAVGSIFNNNSSGNLMFNAFGARIDTADPYDAFTVYPSSGTITGSVAVYGYSL